MNGPEGFLPKNQNFMTQVAQILWYCPMLDNNESVICVSLKLVDFISMHFSSQWTIKVKCDLFYTMFIVYSSRALIF